MVDGLTIRLDLKWIIGYLQARITNAAIKKGITDGTICNPFEIAGGGDRSRTDE